MWERWYEAIKEEKRLQSKKDITVQCIDFCENTTAKVQAVPQRAPPDLRGGTSLQHPRVLVETLCFQENPHSGLQILHAGMFQVLRRSYMILRVLSTTENQEAQELLDEIQQKQGVFVLSGPTVAITNVATSSEFLADGWSTESVSRVVRAARTRKQWEGARRTRILQLHTRRDDDFRHLSKNQKMTRTMKHNSHNPTHCKHEDKLQESMITWGIHKPAHWYACYILVNAACALAFLQKR